MQLTEVQGVDGTHSPAKGQAGVQEGDVLCRASETALHSNDDLQKQVALSAGQPIKLTLERGDAEKSVTVTPCRGQNRCVPHRRARARQSGRNRHADLR